VSDPLAVVVLEDLVEEVEHPAGRFGVGTEQLVDGRFDHSPRQTAARKRTQDVPQRRSRQHLLQQPRGIGLVEKAAVEPRDRLDAQCPVRLLREHAAREQLLADRVTDVMRQDMRGLDAQVDQQRFMHVGVVMHRVAVGDGLVGESHAEHVGRDHGEPGGQPVP